MPEYEDESLIKVESYSRHIEWINGIPTPVSVPLISDRGVKEMVPTALSLPYVGRKVFVRNPTTGEETILLDIEPEFVGMNNLEVMVIKEAQLAAAGNSEATHRLLDRVLGKPKQQNENLNVNASYSEFLDMCDAPPPRSNPINVTPQEDPFDFSDL